MSNQTVDVLKALYRAAWELHQCNPPRDNGRSLQAIWLNDLSALVDQFVREQQALPDRESELLAEIERLNIRLVTTGRQFNEAQDKLRDAEFYKNKLQQQLDSLTARLREHNERINNSDCYCFPMQGKHAKSCPHDHMIKLENNDALL